VPALCSIKKGSEVRLIRKKDEQSRKKSFFKDEEFHPLFPC
jgi:hypothetical protein